jgi:hypothetical protein
MFGTEIFPASGNIPPNAVFYARDRGTKLRLYDEIGTPVPLEYEEVGPQWTRLRPSAPLENGKLYALKIGPEFKDEWGYGEPPPARYQVQGEPDTVPPRPPASAEFVYENGFYMQGTSCQSSQEGYTVSTSKGSDDRASPEQLAIAVVTDSAPERVLALLPPGRAFMGSHRCLKNFDISGQRNAVVAVRSVDLAGNLSAPGAIVALAGDGQPTELPESPPSLLETRLGRGLSIAAVLGVLGVLGLGVFVVRRLRR